MEQDKKGVPHAKKSRKRRGNGLTPRNISPKVRKSNQRRKNNDENLLEL